MHDLHDGDDEPHPRRQPRQLRGGVFPWHALLQLRDQVGHRDVDETARGDDEQVGEQRLPRPDDEVADHAAGHGRQPRQRVVGQRPAPREACVEQHDVVAHLLRDLVRDDRQRGHDAQAHVGQEGGRDDHAVAEVVDAVADQHAPAPLPGLQRVEVVVVVVPVAFVVVRVAVQLGLLEQEEEQQPREQRGEQRLRVGATLERLGQDIEQRGGEQHAGRQADQVLDHARQQRHRQAGRDDDRQQAAEQGREDDVAERHGRAAPRRVAPAAARRSGRGEAPTQLRSEGLSMSRLHCAIS